MKSAIVASAGLLVWGVAVLLSGCEDSTSTRVTIAPDEVTVRYGQQVSFTANGGYEYSWSLDQETWGILSSRTGEEVVYTSRYDPGTNIMAAQVLRVAARLDGDGSTNDAAYTLGAEAYIKHIH